MLFLEFYNDLFSVLFYQPHPVFLNFNLEDVSLAFMFFLDNKYFIIAHINIKPVYPASGADIELHIHLF